MKETLSRQRKATAPPSLVVLSLNLPSSPLCFLSLPAPSTTQKPIKVFKLPDFPASLSFHSVQSYYIELIQQLGKAIFSVQSENSAMLARYSLVILYTHLYIILYTPISIFMCFLLLRISFPCALFFYKVVYSFIKFFSAVADTSELRHE